MISTKEIMETAKKVGVESRVGDLLSRAEALYSDESFPRAAFLGSCGAGKTTLMNIVLGTEVREPQMLPDDSAKPLRVSFDRRSDDKRYDCAAVVSDVWSEAVDGLYEFNISEAFVKDEGEQSAAREDIDYWFFAVNASMPFNSTEIEVLKKLPPESVTVLITRTDLLRREKDTARVKEFIGTYCKRLNLGEPIACDVENGAELAKALRARLPDDTALAALRRVRSEALAEKARELVRAEARKAIEENEKARHDARESSADDDLQLQRKKAAWSVVRANILESGIALSGEVEKMLFSHQDELANELYRSGQSSAFSDKWCETELPRKTEECLAKLLGASEHEISLRIDRDLAALLRKAEELQIVPQKFSLDTDGPTSAKGLPKDKRGGSTSFETTKLVALSVAAVGGIVLLRSAFDLSGAVTAAATAAAAGAVSQQYRNVKRTKAHNWRDALRHYAEQNLKKLSQTVREEILAHYDGVAEMISRNSALQKVEFDDSPFDRRREELEAILRDLSSSCVT